MPLILSPADLAVSSARLPFAEQIAFFRGKLNLPTAHWDDIKTAAHDRAFIVAGAQAADLLDDLRQAVDKVVAQGGTLAGFRKDFARTVQASGWGDYTGGFDWRTRVIYRTNMATSYAAGRLQQLKDGGLPYWMYRHSDSVAHPRPLHVSWNGLTLPANHPWFATNAPPNGWGCMCRLVGVTRQSAEMLGGRVTDMPPDDGVEADGRPRGIDKGWDYQPGGARDRAMQELIDRKLITLPASIGAAMWANLAPVLAMERQARWWELLDQWLADPVARGRSAVVGVMRPDLVDSLKRLGITPAGAEITVDDRLVVGAKARRHAAAQDGLTPGEWRDVPRMLGSADIYRQPADGHLVWVSDGAGPAKVSVELGYRLKHRQGETNRVVSAFRTSAADVAAKVKGGVWEKL